MSSVAMSALSAFATPVRACMLPNGLTGPRLRRPHRPIRSDGNFQICHFSKRNLASIGIGLAVTTLLLVVFAYHGGSGVGSWFHSLLVVVSVLAFVFFGPLFLCLCYYRQMQVRQMTEALRQMRVESGTQTASSESRGTGTPCPARPHLYACIIIAPAPGVSSGDSRYSGLPAYEDALANSTPFVRQENDAENLPDSSTPPPTYAEAIDMLGGSAETERLVPDTHMPPVLQGASGTFEIRGTTV